MAMHQAKSILFRQREENDEPDQGQQPEKIPRLGSPSETVPTTKIINLNDGCLKKIFGFLDLKSLFNVAVANEALRPAAGEVYKSRFGAKAVHIEKCDDFWPKTLAFVRNDRFLRKPSLNESCNVIEIRGLHTTLRFLRCLGGSTVTDLTIDYNKSMSKRYEHLQQYVNNFCVENLISIKFLNMPNIAIDGKFQKVFSNVKSVIFCHCDMGQQWKSFSKWFPNVQNLELTTIPVKTLLRWIKPNSVITNLVVNHHGLREVMPINSNEVQQLINGHPTLVELCLPCYRFRVKDVISLVGKMKSLKKFHFEMKQSDYYDEYFVNHLNAKWEGSIHACYGINYDIDWYSDEFQLCDEFEDFSLVKLTR